PVVSELPSSRDDREDDLTDDGQLESCAAVPDEDTGISGKTQDPCGSQIDSSGIDFLISFHKKLEFFRSKESHRAEKSRKEDHREDLTDSIWLETLPVVSDLSSSSSSSCEANEDTAICSSQIDSIEPESVEEALHETEAQTSSLTETDLAVESWMRYYIENRFDDLFDDSWLETLPVVSELPSSRDDREDDLTDDGQLESCVAVPDEDTGISGKTQDPCGSQIDTIEPESVEETRPAVYESSSEDDSDDGQLKSYLVVEDVHTYSRTEDPCRSRIESSWRISLHETERKRLQGVSYLPDVITEDPAPSSQSEEEVVGKKKKSKKRKRVRAFFGRMWKRIKRPFKRNESSQS
ncbi:hypothetical protein IRJ41_000135, partial [Triplophysa rosa]